MGHLGWAYIPEAIILDCLLARKVRRLDLSYSGMKGPHT